MTELNKILDGKADAVVKAINAAADQLNLEGLAALNDAESAGQKRQTVLVAIAKAMEAATAAQAPADDAEQEEAAQAAEAVAAAAKESGKAARGEKPAELPAWKKPDYTGPLTCEQAFWRNANIKAK